MVLISVFGSEALQRQASDIYLVRALALLAAGFAVMAAVAGLLAFAAWWLKTRRSERLRGRLFS